MILLDVINGASDLLKEESYIPKFTSARSSINQLRNVLKSDSPFRTRQLRHYARQLARVVVELEEDQTVNPDLVKLLNEIVVRISRETDFSLQEKINDI